jgi:hypothetical protein
MCLHGCQMAQAASWAVGFGCGYSSKSLRGPAFISNVFGVCVGLVPEGAWSLWDFCAVDSSAV